MNHLEADLGERLFLARYSIRSNLVLATFEVSVS